MKTLVVYFSRSGNTRTLARQIAIALDARVEDIVDREDRSGIRGYLRSGRDAWFERRAEILPAAYDPSAFDVVVVGTPIWNASLSTPVRSYLAEHAGAFHNVAFFCTMGGRGSKRVFRQMRTACHMLPLATFACTEKQLSSKELPGLVQAFTARLRAAAPPDDIVVTRMAETATAPTLS